MKELIQNKKLSLEQVYKYLFLFIPISVIIGNLILNINIIIIDLIFIYLFFKQKIKFNNLFIFFLILFTFIILVNNFITLDNFLTAKASLGLLKYIIFFSALMYFFEKFENKKLFFKYILFTVLFVSTDVLIQYIFGYDIFGISPSQTHGQRLSGPFGDELIAGAYLSKLLFLGLIYMFYIKLNNLFIFSYILFLLIIILLTQERSAFIISLLSSFLFFLFVKTKFKFKILLFLFASIILIFLINFDKNLKNKYLKLTILQLGFSQELHMRDTLAGHKIETFWDSRYGAHFLTAHEIFKDNKYFGSGLKTFRIICGDPKYKNIKSAYVDKRCNTHPHNIYLEILSEGGLILFLIFVFTIIFIIFINLKNIFKKRFEDLNLINICIVVTLFFPIQTTGSFFSTFNGVFYWIGLAVLFNNSNISFFSFLSQNQNDKNINC